jgi:hypothetical protein
MTLDLSTFDYIEPTPGQFERITDARNAAAAYAACLEALLPEGPDKTYLLRKFREVAMWAVVALTRLPDGSPRRSEAYQPAPGREMYPGPPERAPTPEGAQVPEGRPAP